MAADLRDRLSDLAGATPAGAPPADLWSRGVRRRRVGQAGTALLVAVLVVLVGFGGWTWHTNRVVQPADPGSVTRVPDRLYPPNPWLHAYEGPPGRLIAVLPATRRTFWHEQGGFVGVTASTGRYGFLRLPGMVVNDLTFDAPVSLSPDGQRLAVWVTGPVRGRPHGPTPVAGLDVYDLVTGEVQRWRPPTVHGLSTDTLSWAGGDTLLANFGQWAYGGPSPDGFASGEKTYRWDLPSGQPHPLPRALQGLSSTATGHRLVIGHGHGVVVADLDGAAAPVEVTRLGARTQPLWVNPSGTRLIGLQGDGNSGHLVTGRIPDGGGDLLDRSTLNVGRPRHVYAVVGWLDDGHAIVEVGVTGPAPRGELDSLDVRTGQVRPLIDHFVVSQVATDLLTGPSVHANPPPSPPDPRYVLGWSLALAVLAGLALWGLRVRRT